MTTTTTTDVRATAAPPSAAAAPAAPAADAPAAASPADTRHLVIQQTLVPPDGHTKFVDMLVGMDNPRVTHRFFSWRRAIFGRYDVFHVHWPELTIRGKTPWRRFWRRRYLDAFLIRAALLRTPIVRHLHNVEPHEPGDAAERRSLQRFDQATDVYIRLNPTTQPPTNRPVITALHGHYRAAYAGHPLPDSEPGRVLYFGIIRPYKGVDALARAFTQLVDAPTTNTSTDTPAPHPTLRIVGSPSVGQREMVESHTRANPLITATLRYVSDAELADEIGRAEVVVLPYNEMHNSGAILVAASLGRPVLAPRTPSNTALADEVGPGWIILYDGEITAEVLRSGIAQVREDARTGHRSSQPDLHERDWDHVGRIIEGAYRLAIARAKGRAR